MAKKTQNCKRCGISFGTMGSQCPKCGFWNHAGAMIGEDETILLSDATKEDEYVAVQSGPWDPCFSDRNGIVKGGVTLLAGAPGGGKSTIALQLANAIAKSQQREVFLVGAEEKVRDIRARAIRLRLDCLHLIRVMPMGSSADLGEALLMKKDGIYRTCAFVIDSINGICGDDQPAQVEMATAAKDYADKLDAPAILIGHINKDEDFAGKMALQHVVDTTITLFPTYEEYRELITVKNRFGPSNVRVPLLMTEFGLIASDDEDDDDGIDEDEDEDEEENE